MDGEEGYPCKVIAECTYTLSGDTLNIKHESCLAEESETRETIVNLTNHAYFNLTGEK
jgi:aldose 1-epimerase